MHMEDAVFDREEGHRRSAWQRLGERFIDYVRSRTPDHWIMFLAGLALGLLL